MILLSSFLLFELFFTDDEGRLYVKTMEKGENPGEFMHDIFNEDGIFIGKKSIKIFWKASPAMICNKYAVAKKNRLYCLREKNSGYKELVVYKMRWE